jgi:hypothetical protein
MSGKDRSRRSQTPVPRPKAPQLNFSPTQPPSRPPEAPAQPPSRPAEAAEVPKALGSDEASPDDVSVPPIDLDTGFFDAVPVSADSSSSIGIDTETRDPRLVAKLTPAAAKRRARFAKYVTVAVSLASALCVAALVKVAVARSHEEPQALHVTSARRTAMAAPADTAPTAAATQSPPMVDPARLDGAPAEPPMLAEPVAAAASAPPQPIEPSPAPALAASAAPSEAAPSAPNETVEPKEVAKEVDPKEAAKEKAKSRRALEGGKVADAIAAGEQSVAVDPTDAEAWLILGAAYQMKGDGKNAFRSFKACVDQGKRGPKYECAAMLR